MITFVLVACVIVTLARGRTESGNFSKAQHRILTGAISSYLLSISKIECCFFSNYIQMVKLDKVSFFKLPPYL